MPLSKLPDLIAETKLDVSNSPLPCPFAGHAGDGTQLDKSVVSRYWHVATGNFHLFILFDKDNEEEHAEATRINKNLIERAIKFEGSITGEHGVGFGKKKYLKQELGENTVELMRAIKNTIDPKGIMNPKKVLPDPDVD